MVKFRESQIESLYLAKTPKEISRNEIVQIMKMGKPIRIDWPRQVIDLNLISRLLKGYEIHLGMYASKINFHEDALPLECLILDDEEVQKYIAQTYDSGYGEVWKAKMARSRLQTQRATLLSSAKSTNTRFIFDSGKILGVVMVEAFYTYRRKLEQHLAWIWINQNLPGGHRQAIAHSLLGQVAQLAPAEILASVYLQNRKAYSFLKRAGFENICVTIHPFMALSAKRRFE